MFNVHIISRLTQSRHLQRRQMLLFSIEMKNNTRLYVRLQQFSDHHIILCKVVTAECLVYYLKRHAGLEVLA